MLSRAARALAGCASGLPAAVPVLQADVSGRLTSGLTCSPSPTGQAGLSLHTPWARSFSSDPADGAAASTSGRSDDAASAASPTGTACSSSAGSSPGPDPELLRLLLNPFPKTSKYHGLLSQNLDSVHGQWFMNPEATLRSMVRALYVVKHMLRQDAHILVVNTNKLMKPLMQEAATCCMNPNVWFLHDRWTPGTLTNPHHTRTLFRPAQQPARKLFAAKGLRMTNPHAPAGDPSTGPPPTMPPADKWSLFDHTISQAHYYPDAAAEAERLLVRILDAEAHLARADIPGSLPGRLGALRLMIVLDPSYNSIALREAEQTNVLTVGLVNHHSRDLPSITFPVYAQGNNPNFQHFFLDWLLKVANVDVDPLRAEEALGAAAAAAGGSSA